MKNLESLKSEKFEKLSENELKSVNGGCWIAWGKANTRAPDNGHIVDDYVDEDGVRYMRHIGKLWF